MNIQSIKEFFTPDFAELEKKVLKVNFLTVLITFAITFIFGILGLFLPEGTLTSKLMVILLSPLIALGISPLIIAYVFVLYLINIFKVKGNKYINYFNFGAAIILLISQVMIVLGAYLGVFLKISMLGVMSGFIMPFMIIIAFFTIFVNLIYAVGVGIIKFIKTLKGE